MSSETSSVARRSFIKDSGLMIAGGAIGGAVAACKAVKGGEAGPPIKIAFVGCGRRAKELADAVLQIPDRSIRVGALADIFGSQTQSMYRSLKGRFPSAIDDDCIRSSGADCLDAVLKSDVDAVYVATPPVYRPDYFREIVAAGKHVFLEKPVASDISGVLDVLKTSQQAETAGLSVHVGFQRRYDKRYQDIVARIHEGVIGQPVFAKAICNAGPIRRPIRNGNETESEFQLRNWNHFQWTGGDFLVEQHVAGLDVIRWAIGQSPIVAQGQGGWRSLDGLLGQSTEVAGQPEVFDHHSVEYEFASGAVLLSQCRRVSKAWNNTSEHVYGTQGRANLTAGKIYSQSGEMIWASEHPYSLQSATMAQQRSFLDSIGTGSVENQIESAANSTMAALLGHTASQTAKRVRLDRLIKEASSA